MIAGAVFPSTECMARCFMLVRVGAALLALGPADRLLGVGGEQERTHRPAIPVSLPLWGNFLKKIATWKKLLKMTKAESDPLGDLSPWALRGWAERQQV